MSYRAAFYPGSTPGVLTPGGNYNTGYRAAFYPGSAPGTLYAGGTYPGRGGGTPVPGTGAVMTPGQPNLFSNILNSLFSPTARPGVPANAAAAQSNNNLLLIGGAVLLFVMLSKKKG